MNTCFALSPFFSWVQIICQHIDRKFQFVQVDTIFPNQMGTSTSINGSELQQNESENEDRITETVREMEVESEY